MNKRAARLSAGADGDHCGNPNHQGGDLCIMNDANPEDSGINELCVDHLYQVRDAEDGL